MAYTPRAKNARQLHDGPRVASQVAHRSRGHGETVAERMSKYSDKHPHGTAVCRCGQPATTLARVAEQIEWLCATCAAQNTPREERSR